MREHLRILLLLSILAGASSASELENGAIRLRVDLVDAVSRVFAKEQWL